jgi:hypothetical protein
MVPTAQVLCTVQIIMVLAGVNMGSVGANTGSVGANMAPAWVNMVPVWVNMVAVWVNTARMDNIRTVVVSVFVILSLFSVSIQHCFFLLGLGYNSQSQYGYSQYPYYGTSAYGTGQTGGLYGYPYSNMGSQYGYNQGNKI